MKTQEEHEKVLGRKLTPPFLIQMSSGESNKHCDFYNHGSFHKVRKDEDGNMWIDGRINCIPKIFDTTLIDFKLEVKLCPKCKNEFPKDWPFISYKDEEICVRDYEKYNHVNRDNYRDAVRAELKIEFKIP